jgi:DNA-binding response OmpR family regulator
MRRVLVVVDDPTTRQMIAVHIEKEGYGVVVAQGMAARPTRYCKKMTISLLHSSWGCRTCRALT